MKISGYTTSRNTVSLDYSLKECVQSLLQFCDEVVIGDSSDIDDGTRDLILDLEKQDSRVKAYHIDLDYTAPNHGIHDGWMKGFARSQCTGDWLVQCDLDEIFHESDITKMRPLCEQLNQQENIHLIATPVVEYWGGLNKVRCDINPWKPRLSRNHKDITHGIPTGLRVLKDNLTYVKPGTTDGCDYVSITTGNPIQFASFMPEQVSQLRALVVKDSRYINHYQQWFNDIIEQLPAVFHFSWFSIERKIKTYKKYWNKHWQALYGETLSDDNMFFDVPWGSVSDEMIKQRAKELRDGCGGHIFHQKWNNQKTNHIEINCTPPSLIQEWIKNHTDE